MGEVRTLLCDAMMKSCVECRPGTVGDEQAGKSEAEFSDNARRNV